MARDFVSLTEEFVKKQLESVDSSHDFLHIDRVRRSARKLVHDIETSGHCFANDTYESILRAFLSTQHDGTQSVVRLTPDLEVIEMAALLHDVGDFKYATGKDMPGQVVQVGAFLEDIQFSHDKASTVLFIVEHVSYRKELENPDFVKEGLLSATTSEEMAKMVALAIVQDADRLDAIGPIGSDMTAFD
jgi:uncharacterized protein